MRAISHWRLLVGASVIQVLAACALRVMPLPALRMLFGRVRPLFAFAHRPVDSEARVTWAIEATGRRLARVRLSTCLVRAIAADVWLSTPERPLRLTIGVRRSPAGGLQSHAWLADAARQEIVIGGPAVDEFLPLVAWNGLSA